MLQKLILVSMAIMTIAVPIAAARTPSPHLALRRTVWWTVAAVCGYVAAVVLVYPRVLK